MAKTQGVDETCSMEIGINAIAGKWKLPILWRLIQGTDRFNELQRALTPITQKTLTQQLREIERDGLVHRRVYAEVPLRVEYSLTALGESICPVFDMLCQWGKRVRNSARPDDK